MTYDAVCIYHASDLDGKCSAAITAKYFRERDLKIYLIGANYGDEPPYEKLSELLDPTWGGLLIVDFSYPRKDMLKLCETYFVHWIDHHITAIEEMKGTAAIVGMRDPNFAACELTWKYLFPKENMPWAVKMLGRYDVWDHSVSDVLPFQYGMRLHRTDLPYALDFWFDLLSKRSYAKSKKILEEGRVVLRYITQDNRVYAERCAFHLTFAGRKALAVNRLLTNSKIFDAVPRDRDVEILITFGWMKNTWYVSLYAAHDGINVGEIAKQFGGGGHAGAAGFKAEELPKDLERVLRKDGK